VSNTQSAKKRADSPQADGEPSLQGCGKAVPEPAVLLFGPTAVGKTELLLNCFSSGYEVISADSMQVYTGLDIGTAKPSPAERSKVPHHLIDCIPPDRQFTVGQFVHQADVLVREIRERGNIPVISGGTAYYFKHFLYGLPKTPPADPRVRRRLAEELKRKGAETLYEELLQADPAGAGNISPRDTYRILRALEVFRSTGKPLSQFAVPAAVRPHLRPILIGLSRERAELDARIKRRVSLMFRRGLVDEVRRLISQGASAEWPGMQGIGYREFFQWRREGEGSTRTAAERITANSRRYARQQMTFFSSLPDIFWVHPDRTEEIRRFVLQKLAESTR